MKITSLEIKQHEFNKTFRGYNIDEVDIFLNNLAQEWDRMANEARMLRMQLEIAEKEAAKLREVEVSLIRTLQTAENTSSKITEQAKMQAEKQIDDAKIEAERVMSNAKSNAEKLMSQANSEASAMVNKAKTQADDLLQDAKNQVSDNLIALQEKESELAKDINSLEARKLELISFLKNFSNQTLESIGEITVEKKNEDIIDQSTVEVTSEEEEVIQNIEDSIASPANEETEEVHFIEEETIITEVTEVISEREEEIIAEEEEEEIVGFSSNANHIVLEDEPVEITSVAGDDLTIIEGIGPKIAALLGENGISTFRDLATTPAYKIKDILEIGGPAYTMHDPSSWAEQAILADSGRMEELEALKERLIGGKEPKEIEKIVEESIETPEQATEEMLDRVNKVKAALKKAMMGKEGQEEPSKVKTLNDVLGEKKSETGSFFDSLN